MRARQIAMVLCIATVSLIFAEGTARAEDGAAQLQLQSRLHRAEGMRIVGIVHTSLGIATTVVAGGFLVSGIVAEANNDPEQPTMGGFASFLASGIWFAGSVVALAVGIPLWVVGARRRARLTEGVARLPMPSFAADPARSTYGFGLTWAF